MVMHIASLQSLIATRYLSNQNIQKDNLYYIYFDKNGKYIQNNFKL
jgi:molybdopterin/thiamine biosynthesis adenylyltransferase